MAPSVPLSAAPPAELFGRDPRCAPLISRRPAEGVEDRDWVEVVAPAGDFAIDDGEHRDVPVAVGRPGAGDLAFRGVLEHDHTVSRSWWTARSKQRSRNRVSP